MQGACTAFGLCRAVPSYGMVRSSPAAARPAAAPALAPAAIANFNENRMRPRAVLPRLGSIREMRTRIGVTQKRLAGMAGVSTSMINQIESGRTKPSYETASRIFDSLVTLEGRSSSHTAGDFCCTEIVRLAPTDTLREAVSRMQAFSISQVPVFNGESPVGIVSEDGIMRHLADGERAGAMDRVALVEAMDPAPPIVDYETPANVLVPLLRFTKCILVSRKARIVGIITASDALKMMES